jgi:hypothetical protein
MSRVSLIEITIKRQKSEISNSPPVVITKLPQLALAFRLTSTLNLVLSILQNHLPAAQACLPRGSAWGCRLLSFLMGEPRGQIKPPSKKNNELVTMCYLAWLQRKLAKEAVASASAHTFTHGGEEGGAKAAL